MHKNDSTGAMVNDYRRSYEASRSNIKSPNTNELATNHLKESNTWVNFRLPTDNGCKTKTKTSFG